MAFNYTKNWVIPPGGSFWDRRAVFTPKAPMVSAGAKGPGPLPAETGGDYLEALRRRRRRSGRQQTILAGDLEPLDVGKRTLLG